MHEGMWKGANRRFKKVPWNAIEGRKLSHGVGREEWSKRVERENERRASKVEKLKEIGYEFEGAALKGVDTVPVKEATKAAEQFMATAAEPVSGETADGDVEMIEEEKTVVVSQPHSNTTMVISEEITVTKTKKGGKGKAKAKAEVEGGPAAGAAVKKGTEKVKDGAAAVAKKGKRKSEDGAAAVADQAKKAKKSVS